MSIVSQVSIDWTRMGWGPPIPKEPTSTVRVGRRLAEYSDGQCFIGAVDLTSLSDKALTMLRERQTDFKVVA
ncbi:MAG: hypothetical protein WCK17_13150, partial [Verrucomicrobiota bacterium]